MPGIAQSKLDLVIQYNGLKVRSPKQLVAHLLHSDDEIGPIEEDLNLPAPASVATKQDLSDLDDASNVIAYEIALEILERRQQRVEKCNDELAIRASILEKDLTIADNDIADLGENYCPLGDRSSFAKLSFQPFLIF